MTTRTLLIIASVSIIYTCNSAKENDSCKKNDLQYSLSPYLRLHECNPIDWKEWKDETFKKAKKEDKPIFISIGYSSCHWCHVMNEESFNKKELANVINKNFVAIKIDREEHPNVDEIYMKYCTFSGRSTCGWPLNLFLLPERQPFLAFTYLPLNSSHERTGILNIAEEVAKKWKDEKPKIENIAYQAYQILNEINKPSPSKDNKIKYSDSEKSFNILLSQYDDKNGGFKGKPKFPNPGSLIFLTRYSQRTKDEKSKNIVIKTLNKMKHGGIWDHIGYGFHRYTIDEKWIIPHFEKMLYNQALNALSYIEAYEKFGIEDFKETTNNILKYTLRNLKDKNGGFYSSEDADSDGEEGKFYLWHIDHIRSCLNEKNYNFFVSNFNIEVDGNFRDEATKRKTGLNIPYLKTINDATHPLSKKNDEWNRIRSQLLLCRDKKIRPRRDEKILSDWNSLMIVALARAGRIFNEKRYIKFAEKTHNFLNEEMTAQDGSLKHRFYKNTSGLVGTGFDVAALIMAEIELYQATGHRSYLDLAREHMELLIKDFSDPSSSSGFFQSALHEPGLIVRSHRIYDSALPSVNALAYGNVRALYDLVDEEGEKLRYKKIAINIENAFYNDIFRSPVRASWFFAQFEKYEQKKE